MSEVLRNGIRRWSKTGSLAVVTMGVLWASAVAAATPPDAWITTKAKLALMTTEGVSATAVSVDTVNGDVTLHGKVESAAEKDKAETVVKKIDGARTVRNLLQVVAPRHKAAVQESDDHIKDRVKKALKADTSLSDSKISVQSVDNGVVLLAGSATSLSDHLSAVETAASVRGVRRVASEIQSPDTLADSEIWHQGKATKAARSTGDAARDMWVTSATKMRLLADGRTPALDINVDTHNGVVTLFGMVPSAEAKAAAAADARKVSGVARVVNELQVVPKAKQERVKANDDQIEKDVKAAFANHEDLKDVSVEVKNCVARLSGEVDTGTKRLEAAVVARATRGVCSVQDDLHISN